MRILEASRYSSSLEANMNRLPEPKVHMKRPHESLSTSPKISSSIANPDAKNPFYDESKNPFAEDDAEDKEPTNPFDEDDDDEYNKNLNPFA